MKTILIALLALSSFAASADSILDIQFECELGYLPQDNWVLHQTEYTDNQNLYWSTKAELLLFNTIFAGGSMRNDFSSTEAINSFNPSEMQFGAFCGIRIGNFEIGIRHFCFHPVMTYIGEIGTGEINAEGSYTEIYVKLSGKINIF